LRKIEFSYLLIVPTTTPLCPTAVWNQTLSIVAGSTGTYGSTSTLLYYPYDMDFDGYRNMYVVDYYNNRIQKLGSNVGTTVAGFNLASGSSRSELYYPTAISVTPNGTMYILDGYNYRVLKWTVGDPLGYIVAGGSGSGTAFTQIGISYGLYVDSMFNIYISEQGNNRVTKWLVTNTTSGTLVRFYYHSIHT
jgi:hypothetical protein